MNKKWIYTLVFAGGLMCLSLLGGVWSDAAAQEPVPTIPTLPGSEIPIEVLPIGTNGDMACFKPFPANSSVRLCVYIPAAYGGSNVQMSNPTQYLAYPSVTPAYVLGQPFNFNFSVTAPQPYDPPLIFYVFYEEEDVVQMFEPFLKFWVYKDGDWSEMPSSVDVNLNMVWTSVTKLDSPTTFSVFDAGTRKYYFPLILQGP